MQAYIHRYMHAFRQRCAPMAYLCFGGLPAAEGLVRLPRRALAISAALYVCTHVSMHVRMHVYVFMIG